MEHLNRKLKTIMQNLGPNITPQTIERAAKAFGIVNQVCTQFKKDSEITSNKPYHSMPFFTKDLEKITEHLSLPPLPDSCTNIWTVDSKAKSSGCKQ